MGKEIATQLQEVQTVPGRINPRRNTPRHIVIKLTEIKDKEKLLKATREKRQITYKGTLIRLTADSSAETVQAKREWHNIFKRKNRQPRLLYPGFPGGAVVKNLPANAGHTGSSPGLGRSHILWSK